MSPAICWWGHGAEQRRYKAKWHGEEVPPYELARLGPDAVGCAVSDEGEGVGAGAAEERRGRCGWWRQVRVLMTTGFLASLDLVGRPDHVRISGLGRPRR